MLQVSDFLWTLFSNTGEQQRLYGIKGIEVTQLADDMPDKDTKARAWRPRTPPLYSGQFCTFDRTGYNVSLRKICKRVGSCTMYLMIYTMPPSVDPLRRPPPVDPTSRWFTTGRRTTPLPG